MAQRQPCEAPCATCPFVEQLETKQAEADRVLSILRILRNLADVELNRATRKNSPPPSPRRRGGLFLLTG